MLAATLDLYQELAAAGRHVPPGGGYGSMPDGHGQMATESTENTERLIQKKVLQVKTCITAA